ncbi:UDP-N-acetylmuramoyl-tripeptide--D-alanyl-D-alanine ligase [Pseudogemmobacter faecipullorum]|uniref:UDP-N-acetylmuramoyl-tripeptide--D-alanyl-D-alanine ligase n=1 Tax=Pseudogemmobacter faecipullorum TaxID=2755041 RepID=A0ABS8CL50_9RHOB|nr:UDP-N-acetylmuramoyl-tripeptide--D-alanyl-D-alanine ligase [Pseudogemmobacter faecipullorum]MCB5410119.1 UDP-N-acetylmuramoyl-tripeptide--D-alanyl-D-alanine ligase [Pseudogemmobacter faecipullorum]
MTALWTSAEAEAATLGHATRAFSVSGVSIDTRTLRPGDLFVALAAARDGHDFVAQALEKGAAAALVSHIPEGLDETAPLLIVDDVLKGLEDLGRAARARTGARVIGVTGSVGKTSTKEMLRAMLSGQGRTHAAEASYNNHWGVPLTLARMPADTEYAVIEIGMSNPGEIAPLARLARPHVAMITTVAAAHLAAFGSLEGIAREKGAIFDGLEPGGAAVINLDLETTPVLLGMAQARGAQVIGFGAASTADWRLDESRSHEETTVVRAHHGADPVLFKVASPGRHFALNALGALAAATALGADTVIAAHDLGRWAPPAGRGTRERIVVDSVDETYFDLIDDAFNANPSSMAASLEVLIGARPVDGIGALGAGRRIAILGDMLELGPEAEAMHRAIAAQPGLASVRIIHCVGPLMRHLHAALPLAQRGEWVETASELASRARMLMDPGDILLVKGSKGSKVSLVAEALRRLGQSV